MNCKTMNVIDILDELSRKAQNDMELKNRLLATKESSNSVSDFQNKRVREMKYGTPARERNVWQ